MKLFILVIVLLAAFTTTHSQWNPEARTITFEDHFNGDQVNNNVWEIQEGNVAYGANRSMCFTKNNKNVRVQNGCLILTAVMEEEEVDCDLKRKLPSKKKYTSGRVKSRAEFNFTAIEFEARFPKGSHLQPGLWTQKSNQSIYEEIDVVEIKGNETLAYFVNAHWGRNYSHLIKTIKGAKVTIGHDLSLGFHNYTVEILRSSLNFYFDRRFVATIEIDENLWRQSVSAPNVQCTPFFEPKHIIMSLLIGGNWFRNELTPEMAKNWEKVTLEVTRVTAYE